MRGGASRTQTRNPYTPLSFVVDRVEMKDCEHLVRALEKRTLGWGVKGFEDHPVELVVVEGRGIHL